MRGTGILNKTFIIAMGNSPSLIRCLLQSYEASIREYRREELDKVEAERRATIEVIRTTNVKAKKRTDDPRYLVVDEWFQDEIFRINRLIEFKKESWWVRALSAVDLEGQSALHYLAANDAANAGDLLKEMLQGGQGMYVHSFQDNFVSFAHRFGTTIVTDTCFHIHRKICEEQTQRRV